MSWNHRVVRRKDARGTESGEWFTVCEVYYNKDGSPAAHTVDAVGVCGETIDGMRQSLEWMQRALNEPILNEEEDFVGFKDDPNEE